MTKTVEASGIKYGLKPLDSYVRHMTSLALVIGQHAPFGNASRDKLDCFVEGITMNPQSD
jgi:hypothetical protein